MAQTLRQIAKRGLATVTGLSDGSQINKALIDAKDLGDYKLSGKHIAKLTGQIETGLLTQNVTATYTGLDQLVYLLEMQAEQSRATEPAARSFTWHTGVTRLAAARMQHALMRIPGFGEHLAKAQVQDATLPQRIMGVLADFTALTRAHMRDEPGALTPEDWLQTRPEIAAMRGNLGVGYYHLSRVLEAGDYADADILAGRDQTFAENFDVMFYAIIYGPLTPGLQTAANHTVMQRHLEDVENYLQSPQPAIRADPERFAIPTSHVAHILSTVDQAQQILPLLLK